MKLELLILAQAVEDVLRFELGLPLVGHSDIEEDVYMDALAFMSKYPTLMRKYYRGNKNLWLQEVEDARTESVRSEVGSGIEGPYGSIEQHSSARGKLE
jgi:hypothetical protein